MTGFSLIAFWPFASGWMLMWGVAAAVPFIIHLWNRRRYREVTWAAMEYLLAAVRKNSRRIQVEQWLLLVVRTAILVLLAAALADPLWSLLPASSGDASGQSRTHYVLVLDGSFSMDLRGADGQSLFDSARELARQVVRRSRQGDGFTLVLMADPPQVVIGQPAFAADDVVDEINSLRLPHGGGNLASTLSEVEQIVRRAARVHPRLSDAQVLLFTDLGAATWNDCREPSVRARVGRIAEQATLKLVEFTPPESVANAALTRLEVRDALVTTTMAVAVEAETENFSDLPRQETLRFLIDGREADRQTMQLPPRGRATAVTTVRFRTPGEHAVEVQLSGDALPIDDRRWLSVPVRESLKALCIGGKAGSARHVALALAPSRTDQPRIVADERPESALLELDLHQYDAVFLCNVSRFGRDEAAVLWDYLQHGGGVVIALGDQVQADNYNLTLGDESPNRILPARIGTAIGEARYGFDPLQYRHPIVQPFRDHEGTGLLTTPVWKYFQLEPQPRSAQVALAMNNGDPAIVEERIGRGRSILLATAVSPQSVVDSTTPPTPWTALSSWPSFVPLVQELFTLAASRRDEHRNVLVGESVGATSYGTVREGDVTVRVPQWNVAGATAREERVRMRAAGEDSRWSFGPTMFSGMYVADYGQEAGAEVTSQSFAVNVQTRESALERFDPSELPSQFQPQQRGGDDHDPLLVDNHRSTLFRYLLGLVLILLLVESALAWHIGKAAA